MQVERWTHPGCLVNDSTRQAPQSRELARRHRCWSSRFVSKGSHNLANASIEGEVERLRYASVSKAKPGWKLSHWYTVTLLVQTYLNSLFWILYQGSRLSSVVTAGDLSGFSTRRDMLVDASCYDYFRGRQDR